jgi:hypothetical protein
MVVERLHRMAGHDLRQSKRKSARRRPRSSREPPTGTLIAWAIGHGALAATALPPIGTTGSIIHAVATRLDSPRAVFAPTQVYYDTMSLSFFSGRILTTLRAGLALNVVGSPVNGFVPWRSLVAGLCCTTILQTP